MGCLPASDGPHMYEKVTNINSVFMRMASFCPVANDKHRHYIMMPVVKVDLVDLSRSPTGKVCNINTPRNSLVQ